MNANNYIHTAWNTPFIPQRADPYVLHHGNEWYFTASVPEYDRIVLRRATSLEGLRTAPEQEVWHAHPGGVMSCHVWAPELHMINGKWYIYFAAGEQADVWKIRPWVLRCNGPDPLQDSWTECGMRERASGDEFSFTDFSLDMTIFELRGKHYCIWAEKISVGKKISNLYIAQMASPTRLAVPQMLLSSPSYDWERHGFWVNEGPSVLQACGKVFVSFSASDTSAAYCMGMMWMNEADDPMDISAWHKLSQPVFTTDAGKGIYGPGHNTFFEKDGEAYTSYHARPYDEIVGDPLYDPNRHTFIMKLPMKDGFPVFSLENQAFQTEK